MLHSPSRTKLAAALAAGAFSALTLSGPAMAEPDFGQPSTSTEQVDLGYAKHGGLPAVARLDSGQPVLGGVRVEYGQTDTAPEPASQPAVADDGLEFLQIGLGAVAGAAFTAAALAALGSRRRQHTPQPA